jgi:hypothetical protein
VVDLQVLQGLESSKHIPSQFSSVVLPLLHVLQDIGQHYHQQILLAELENHAGVA